MSRRRSLAVRGAGLPQPRNLTPAEYERLAEIPPEAEWFANLTNPRTRRAYLNDLRGFMQFCGLQDPEGLRTVTRPHILAWRHDLEAREMAPATIRRKMSALSSLFGFLCEKNAILLNPVDGAKRPRAEQSEGKTPVLSDSQAKRILDAPPADTLHGLRDRAILATLLFQGLRRAELASLRVKDLHEREGILHLAVAGKGSRLRYTPVSPHVQVALRDYLAVAGHGHDPAAFLFQATRKHPAGHRAGGLNPNTIYRIVRARAAEAGLLFEVRGICAHSMRATAATNALNHGAGLEETQDWLGHSSPTTTRLYDRRGKKPENSPSFKVSYGNK